MARVLLLLGGGFTRTEFSIKQLLEWKGHNVRVAGKHRLQETSKEGDKVTPDLAFYEINPDYFDCVVVIGEDMKEVARPETIAIIRKCATEKKGVVGVNNGAVMLAFAGILNGKRATVAKSEKSITFLRDSGARYVSDAIVVDGKIITAAHPEAAEEIVAAMAKML
ncbi:MAG: DJ-1/PfpI family protein [Candidatus Micrarchaeota archaeon]